MPPATSCVWAPVAKTEELFLHRRDRLYCAMPATRHGYREAYAMIRCVWTARREVAVCRVLGERVEHAPYTAGLELLRAVLLSFGTHRLSTNLLL